MLTSDWMWFGAAASVAGALTGVVRHHALATGILDIPTARSSHTQPTPRGGGVAIVATIVVGLIILGFWGSLNLEQVMVMVLTGSAIAAVGYIDDKRGLGALPRFAVHLSAAALAIVMLVGRSGSYSFFSDIPAAVTILVLVLGVVWSVNLFNFMDGIDGIAGSQAAFVGVASAFLIGIDSAKSGWGTLPALTAGASAGFLMWNWPPAKIFMGDVGSAFMGFWLAILAIVLDINGVLEIWTSIVLGMLFIADATATLFGRIIAGEKWYEAHRSHVYQRLARRFASHRIVSTGSWILNLTVILPAAYLAERVKWLGPWIAFTLFLVLSGVCLFLGAGRPDRAVR